MCGLVGTSDSGEKRCWDSWCWQHPVFPDLESDRKTDTELSYKVRISVLLLTKLDKRPWCGSVTTVRFLDTPSPCLGLGAPCSRKQRSRLCLCQLPGECCQPSLLGTSGGEGGWKTWASGPASSIWTLALPRCPLLPVGGHRSSGHERDLPSPNPVLSPQPPYQRRQPPSS